MFFWALSFLAISNYSSADVGRIVKIVTEVESYCLRSTQKIPLSQDFSLKSGDEVYSEKSTLSLIFPPGTQLSLAPQTQIKLAQNIALLKGLAQVRTKKKIIVEADGVSFTTKKAEFEISYEGEAIDLDVISGEVEVVSPFVQTFVPEIVKANQGFRFNKKERGFSRRDFSIKFKNAPAFDIKMKR